MFKLAVRNVVRHRMRTALTVGAVVFGVVALVLCGGFVQDVLVQLREATIHSQLGHLQIQRAGYAKIGRRDPYAFLIEQPNKLVEQMVHIPGVRDVLVRLEFSGLITVGRASMPIIGAGIEADKEARLGTFLTTLQGRQLVDADQYGIVVGKGVAGAMLLKPGDSVTLMLNTPDGSLNSLEFTVMGIFQTFSKDYDDRAVRISLPAAQELLSTPSAHSLVFSLDNTSDTDRITAYLRKQLPAKAYEVHSWLDLAEFYRQTVELYKRQFGVLQLIILMMVILGVANSVNMAIFERVGEFGTQMAVGNRRRQVFRLIVTETAILGLVGAVLGVVVGNALAWLINQHGIPMPPPPNSDSGYLAYIRIVPTVTVIAFGVGLVASILASLIPAHRTSRLPIVDALRQNI